MGRKSKQKEDGVLSRRDVLRLIGAGSAAVLAACDGLLVASNIMPAGDVILASSHFGLYCDDEMTHYELLNDDIFFYLL